MTLSQLQKLKLQLGLKWHPKTRKDILQRRIITYLKRKEKLNFEKSADASHWVPPSEVPDPQQIRGNENELDGGVDTRDEGTGLSSSELCREEVNQSSDPKGSANRG